jgi:hypothetical protein
MPCFTNRKSTYDWDSPTNYTPCIFALSSEASSPTLTSGKKRGESFLEPRSGKIGKLTASNWKNVHPTYTGINFHCQCRGWGETFTNLLGQILLPSSLGPIYGNKMSKALRDIGYKIAQAAFTLCCMPWRSPICFTAASGSLKVDCVNIMNSQSKAIYA